MTLNKNERRRVKFEDKVKAGMEERRAQLIARAERRAKLHGKRPKLRSTGIATRKW